MYCTMWSLVGIYDNYFNIRFLERKELFFCRQNLLMVWFMNHINEYVSVLLTNACMWNGSKGMTLSIQWNVDGEI